MGRYMKDLVYKHFAASYLLYEELVRDLFYKMKCLCIQVITGETNLHKNPIFNQNICTIRNWFY